MRENRRRFILGVSLAGLLLMTSAVFAQKKPTAPAPAAARPPASAPAEQPAPVVVDGRTVIVESGGARMKSETSVKVQAAFNRRLSRDLRTYTLAEIISAAEAAAAEGAAAASAAKPKVCVTITCCPVRITIRFPCDGQA